MGFDIHFKCECIIFTNICVNVSEKQCKVISSHVKHEGRYGELTNQAEPYDTWIFEKKKRKKKGKNGCGIFVKSRNS